MYTPSTGLLGANANRFQVSASDKGTGKSKTIAFTNEVGRLLLHDVERMIEEAEHYAEEGMALVFLA